MPAIAPRYYNNNYNGNCYYDNYDNLVCPNSAWNNWVRWVVLAVVIIGFFLLFILCSCITARRRRKMGRQPYYGTGWASRPGNNAQPYYNNTNNYAQPAPPYSAQPQQQGGYYGNNQPYYGNTYGQQQGVELQSPQATHNRDNTYNADVYAPPAGPPPGKGDGIIR